MPGWLNEPLYHFKNLGGLAPSWARAARALGPLADAFFDHPSRTLTVVGVTGTNGKTTTCALLQGVFAGPGATFLFARAVTLLGAGRAVLFTALVPAITLLMGYLALGEVPSVSQLVGLVIVVIGFRLTQQN